MAHRWHIPSQPRSFQSVQPFEYERLNGPHQSVSILGSRPDSDSQAENASSILVTRSKDFRRLRRSEPLLVWGATESR